MNTLIEAFQNRKIQPKQKIEFRLYYDKKTGKPIEYSMQELEGDYIVIDANTYARPKIDIIIKDGKIIKHCTSNVRKLVISPEDTSGTQCHKDDICLVTSTAQSVQSVYWKVRVYE